MYKFIRATHSQARIKYLLKFDGGADGNPGPGGSGCAIYKISLSKPPQLYVELGTYLAYTTNNEAEYTGLISGLTWCRDNQIKNVVIEGDSMLVVKQISKNGSVMHLILNLY